MEESELIREQMEQTRSSLSEKIEALEEHVVQTVHSATGAVADTVETIKEATQGTVETVKQTVQGTFDSIKETLDVPLQFRRRPWLMLGGSVLLGYLAGALLTRRRAQPSHDAQPAPSTPAMAAEPESKPSMLDKVSEALQPQLTQLKNRALGMGLGVVRDLVTNSVHGEIGDELRRLIDDATERLGGKVHKERILPEPSDEAEVAAESGRFAEAWSD